MSQLIKLIALEFESQVKTHISQYWCCFYFYIFPPTHLSPSLTSCCVIISNVSLTSNRYDTHVAPSAVHFGAKEPAVLSNGVAFDAAKWVTRAPPTTNTKQNT